jgi:hypothetical protein
LPHSGQLTSSPEGAGVAASLDAGRSKAVFWSEGIEGGEGSTCGVKTVTPRVLDDPPPVTRQQVALTPAPGR